MNVKTVTQTIFEDVKTKGANIARMAAPESLLQSKDARGPSYDPV